MSAEPYDPPVHDTHMRLMEACATDPLCLASDTGTVLAAAGPWEEAAGLPPSRVEGRALATLVVPDDVLALLGAHELVVIEGTTATVTIRLAGDRKDRVYDATLRRVRPGETAVALRDVTSRRTVEKELRRSNDELQRFAYVASHDLSEPLRMVTSYCGLLADEYGEQLDDDARDYLHFAVDGAIRMRALIDDLLDYSRVGWSAAPAVPVSLTEVFADAVRDVGPAIADAGADVSVGLLPVVRGDEAQLRRVAQNLLANAVKFRAEGRAPQIAVTAVSSGSMVTVSVSDNGIGIPQQHRERVFVMFKRLHARDAYAGTGLGLALCKRIVEMHGGDVWVEEQPQGGSVFRFTLPLAVAGS
jgi:light-regulated signal transduction histidine kinase (bacteriophytochrome)